MLKCVSIYTREIDDPALALEELLGQLHEKLELMEHTVGIVMCHAEFAGTETLKYLGEKLPFDIVGVTTASQAINGVVDELILTIFVMTADDVTFRTGLTDSLEDDVGGPTAEACAKAVAGMADMPKLALIFPPLFLKYPGDLYPNVWAKLLPGTPVFGTIAIDDTVNFTQSQTIYKGEVYDASMPFVLCYGHIHPRFTVATILGEELMPYSGEITKSDGPFLREINNVSAFDYFKSIGLASDDSDANNFLFTPLLVDFKKREDYDGVPVMRGLTMFTDDGAAILRGLADENSLINLSRFTEETVVTGTMQKAQEMLKQGEEEGNVHGILSFSCIVRRMTLQSDPLAESKQYAAVMGDAVPFMFGYAGGEICPTSCCNGVYANRFHNYSLVSLII